MKLHKPETKTEYIGVRVTPTLLNGLIEASVLADQTLSAFLTEALTRVVENLRPAALNEPHSPNAGPRLQGNPSTLE